MDQTLHRPVMVREVLEFLRPHNGGVYFDATVGMGGHAAAILDASGPQGRLIGVDLDATAAAAARVHLARFGPRANIYHANYTDLEYITRLASVGPLDGIVADLGVGSHQLGSADRGFSLDMDGLLDMRYDTGAGRPARDIVNRSSEKELAGIIERYGEERRARTVARAIVRAREKKKIEGTRELAAIVARAIGPPGRWRIHPATRTFMALRISVNDELGSLERFIGASAHRLAPDGRMVIISFHSLEDRIVKNAFRGLAAGGEEGSPPVFTILTRKPLVADESELAQNPRARSAKLRAIKRIPDG
jgi:16S rRNA (cytosine1402-N4)-methyltransferase